MFNAFIARIDSENAKEKGWNYQTRYIMDLIVKRTEIGEFNLIIQQLPSGIYIFEDDYKFFEKLGYKVTRMKAQIFLPTLFNNKENHKYYNTSITISW